jgi:hypothetical protein
VGRLLDGGQPASAEEAELAAAAALLRAEAGGIQPAPDAALRHIAAMTQAHAAAGGLAAAGAAGPLGAVTAAARRAASLARRRTGAFAGAGALALLAAFSGAAAAGALPAPIQNGVADFAHHLGISIPRVKSGATSAGTAAQARGPVGGGRSAGGGPAPTVTAPAGTAHPTTTSPGANPAGANPAGGSGPGGSRTTLPVHGTTTTAAPEGTTTTAAPHGSPSPTPTTAPPANGSSPTLPTPTLPVPVTTLPLSLGCNGNERFVSLAAELEGFDAVKVTVTVNQDIGQAALRAQVGPLGLVPAGVTTLQLEPGSSTVYQGVYSGLLALPALTPVTVTMCGGAETITGTVG